MDEIWKPIPGFEELYEVSNFGNFKTKGGRPGNWNERLLKLKVMSDGYLFVRLNKEKKQLFKNAHRIVASVFIPNPENKAQVNHKNCIKNDNRIENLEWVTPRENIDHALLMGRYALNGGIIKKIRHAVCHPHLKAIGVKNICKSCYMKEWRQNNKEHIKQSRMCYNLNERKKKSKSPEVAG